MKKTANDLQGWSDIIFENAKIGIEKEQERKRLFAAKLLGIESKSFPDQILTVFDAYTEGLVYSTEFCEYVLKICRTERGILDE
jgi:hypothetical protein